MTALEGRPVWAPNIGWMRQLIGMLADIHAIDPTNAAVRPFQPYTQDSYTLPKWVTKPAVWERAIALFHGPMIDEDRAFIHRDFYPGNVLWFHRRVSGVVDWEAASIGPRSMDVAYCRINLLYDDLYQAERFRQEWEAISGHTFHPWADVATIIGLLTATAAIHQLNEPDTTSKQSSNEPSATSPRHSRPERATADSPERPTRDENSAPSWRSASVVCPSAPVADGLGGTRPGAAR